MGLNTEREEAMRMAVQAMFEVTRVFLEYLGLTEKPFGVPYADAPPGKALGPKVGV